MAATVHRLFPDSKGSSQGPVAVNPLIEGLRAVATPILLKQLRAMFEGADDALFTMSERARVDAERTTYFDTMRMLRLEQRRITTAFEADFARNLYAASARPHDPADGIDFERLSIQPTEELEERIAIGNLANKADTLHKELLVEINKRIEFMIRDLGVPISAHALAPVRICEAFRAGTAGLSLDLRVRLLIYKLFDRFSITNLGDVYRPVLQVLEKNGIRPGAIVPPSVYGGKPASTDATATPLPVDEVERMPRVDSATRDALKQLATSTSLRQFRPIDAELAAELSVSAEAALGPIAEGVPPAQRLSLVGQMFGEILSDPHLPDSMRPLFERLRFPLIKISLADGSFFYNRGHPVRRLVAEAAETAASSRAASASVVRRLEDRLRHIAEQIDLSAAFVRPQVAYLPQLGAAEIAAFLDQQREESEARRESVLGKVRRTVAQELEVHTLGRNLPEELMGFLRGGWGPLMAARLLKNGINSRPWTDSVNGMIQILSTMDPDTVTAAQRAARPELVAQVNAYFIDVGMKPEKAKALVDLLLQAYVEIDKRAAERPQGPADDDEFSLFAVERSGLLSGPVTLPALQPAGTQTLVGSSDAFWPNAPSSPAARTLPEPSRVETARTLEQIPTVELSPAAIPNRRSAPATAAPALPPSAHPARTPPSAPAPAASPEPAAARGTPAAADAPVVESPAAEAAPATAPAPAPEAAMPRETPEAPAAAPVSRMPAASTIGIEETQTESELLAQCLTAESWFRVFDPQARQTLWLKVSRYYVEHDSIGFNGFDTTKTLSVRASMFLDDLVAGRSEPVNASPAQLRAIVELRSRAARRH